MNANITKIEPLNLTQDTAVGRGAKRKGVNWYIFPVHLVDDITGWEATADANAHIGHRSALGAPEGAPQVRRLARANLSLPRSLGMRAKRR